MKTTYPGQDSLTRLIGAFSQPGRHQTPTLLGRQRRSDSIIGSLPPEQRAKVDKWLFDKGLTYGQVAEGCQKFFGVKVSKSSVARYCDRELMEQMARKRSEQRAKERAGVSDLHARLTPDEGFQLLIQRVMRLANEAAERVQFSQRFEGYLDRREFRWFLRLMRLLIAARREKNMGIRVQAERAKMEIEVAKAVLKVTRGEMQTKRRHHRLSPLTTRRSGSTETSTSSVEPLAKEVSPKSPSLSASDGERVIAPAKFENVAVRNAG